MMTWMPRHSLLAIHDLYRNGEVSKQLDDWAAEGLTPTEMAFRLRADGIEVDPSTVRRWLRRDEDAAP